MLKKTEIIFTKEIADTIEAWHNEPGNPWAHWHIDDGWALGERIENSSAICILFFNPIDGDEEKRPNDVTIWPDGTASSHNWFSVHEPRMTAEMLRSLATLIDRLMKCKQKGAEQ